MRLEIIHHADRIQINLPAITCLYGNEGQEVVLGLLEIAEQLQTEHDGKYICLILQGPATDRNIKWHDDLNMKLLLVDTFGRIMKFRWLLSLIRKSKIPWIFLAADDCHGSTWELALACHRRYWFSESALVGFPEIAIGGFPAGGSAEFFAKSSAGFKDFWFSHPLVSAKNAFANEYISFCSVIGEDWRTSYATLLDVGGFLENLPTEVSKQNRRFSRTDLSEVFGAETKGLFVEQIDAVRSKVKNSGAPSEAIWDYCWGLIKQRTKLKDSRELGRLIGILTARFYHSRSYKSFIYANCVKFEAERLPRLDGDSVGRLVIDLNFLAPPTAILAAILQARMNVIFVSTEPKTLMSALNMLYNRLERSLGADNVRHFWRGQVAWYCGSADADKAPILRWSADDRVMVVTTEGTFEFLRLDGNSSQAEKGIMEAVNPLSRKPFEFKKLAGIVPLIATGLYENPFKSSKLPLSIFIRSSFFQEVMRIASFCGNDVGNVVQNLKDQKWAFAGDDEAWDRFLSSRIDIYNFDRNYQGLGFQGLSQNDWGIGNFKQARSITKKTAGKSDIKWSPTQTSQHLATYLGLLVLSLSQSSSRADVDIVDHIAGVAIGFPVGLGTPVGYLRERGSRRTGSYSQLHWPDVKMEVALKEIQLSHDVF